MAGASALGFPAIVHSQSVKIRIGHLTPMTGFLGALGEYAVMGMKMAVDEVNAVGDELVATDATDFSPYLLKIRQAKPDLVSSNLAGNQVTNFVKQYAEFGLPYPVVGSNLNTADAWAAGEGNLGGIWPTARSTLWAPTSRWRSPGTRALAPASCSRRWRWALSASFLSASCCVASTQRTRFSVCW